MLNYSDNAKAIYKKLYLQSNESIEECHYRVAKALANDEEEAERFKKLLDEQIVRLNTPCMINAGTNNGECWHACFILDLEDSMDSIINMWEICARIYKGGGGAGVPISNLREKGAPISTGGYASGPISYMRVIQEISNQVKSGGRTRRAANLASFRYDHPDVLDFVNLKRSKDGKFSAFNTSVLVDDVFMSYINTDQILGLKGVVDNKVKKEVRYKDLWNQIVEAAWECGDPGLLFYNRVNEDNPFPSLGDIVSTNPCGEVAGPPWTVCCLGHLNLNKILKDDKLDIDLMEEYIETLVHMLNRMLERSPYPHENFRNRMLQTRPIGVGVMGFADILYKKRIPYNSEQAIQIFNFICHKLTDAAFKASHKYALKNKIKVNVPEEDKRHFFNYLSKFVGKDKANLYMKEGLANSTVTCIAPTGSTAISADCSYSFEPQFALIWQKKLEDGGSMTFINKEFEKACHSLGIKLTETLIDDIKANKGSIKGLIKRLDDVFVVAHDIRWEDRLKMQAAGQEWITQSISSTVNLPNSATVEDVANIYKRAWELRLKGVTIFRDGCLDTQPVDFGGGSSRKAKRPSTLKGITRKMNTGYGTLYLTINELNNKPFEVFAILGKSGRDEAASAEAIGRLVSLCLRSDIPVEEIVKQLEGIGGESQIFSDQSLVKSIPDAIAKMLKNYIDNNIEIKNSSVRSESKSIDKSRICPNCGSLTFIHSGSCRGGVCLACGYSKCE